jgi:crossover junction endodeoxyribonuclease RusA
VTDVSRPYELFVPAAGLKWINSNDRLLWMQKARYVRAWRERTWYVAKAAHLPVIERAHVLAELQFADSRRRDPANWAPTAKACVDGLVDAGVFRDDDHTRVLGPDLRLGERVIGAHVGMRLVIAPLAVPPSQALLLPTEGKRLRRIRGEN